MEDETRAEYSQMSITQYLPRSIFIQKLRLRCVCGSKQRNHTQTSELSSLPPFQFQQLRENLLLTQFLRKENG